MGNDKLHEILDFALQREKEAVAFYRSLQEMAKFEHQKKALNEIENMEKGHVAFIKSIMEKGFSEKDIPEVTHLNISDYLVESPPTADMTYQDILITAMKREEKAEKLYTRLAGDYKDPEAKELFKKLAAEEAKHRLHFETDYDEEILKDW